MLSRLSLPGRSKEKAGSTPTQAIVAADGQPRKESKNRLTLKKRREEEPPEGETHHEHRERNRKNNLKECSNICIFITFLFLFTASMLLDQSASSSRLAEHIRSRLDGAAVPLTSISSTALLHDYLEQVFVPAMYDNSSDVLMAARLSESLHPIDVSNRLLGSVRIRQSRVNLTGDCQVSPMFQNYNISCYPPFSAGVSESTGAYGPDLKFTHSLDEQGVDYNGYLGSYNAHGFMQNLTTGREAALRELQALRNDGFLDEATRAVFVDFTVWNSNVGTYAVVQLVVEFGASGGVHLQLDVLTMSEQSLTPGGFGTPMEWISFFLFIIVVVIVVFKYMLEELQELLYGKLAYLCDGWNLMDWANMILLLVAFVMRMMTFSEASAANLGKAELENKDSFSNLRGLADRVETVKLLQAFNAILLWLKVVKFLRHMPYFKQLIRTVWGAFDLFLPFLLMFSVVFVGFVMAYNIGFGQEILELSSLPSTFVYLCRAFLRDVRLMPAYEITPAFGATLILLFYVTLVLVGLSVLFAIIADSLFRAKHDPPAHKEDHLHEEEPVEEFWREFKHWARKFTKKRMPWVHRKIFKHHHHHHHHHHHNHPDGKGGNSGSIDNLALTDGTFGATATTIATKAGDTDGGPRALTGSWRGSKKPTLALADGNGGGDGNESDSSSSSSSDAPREGQPTEKELKSAIEHMSGRVLSEVSIIGIEIKSELHDVCERIAQMQMAVEELSWRTDKIQAEQAAELR